MTIYFQSMRSMKLPGQSLLIPMQVSYIQMRIKLTSPADVTIHWPSGRVDRFSLEGDGYYRVLEGESPERTTPLP